MVKIHVGRMVRPRANGDLIRAMCHEERHTMFRAQRNATSPYFARLADLEAQASPDGGQSDNPELSDDDEEPTEVDG